VDDILPLLSLKGCGRSRTAPTFFHAPESSYGKKIKQIYFSLSKCRRDKYRELFLFASEQVSGLEDDLRAMHRSRRGQSDIGTSGQDVMKMLTYFNMIIKQISHW